MENKFETLFDDLMALCESSESFYFSTQFDYAQVEYRVFTYRLASYTEFQLKGASECRGHTFRKDGDGWNLASLPMQKFFNYGEHLGWGTEMDLNTMELVMDKVDGSLISTVTDRTGSFFLKSKTSFTSQQAQDATAWLESEKGDRVRMGSHTAHEALGYTVNYEWVSPENQIVIGYTEPRLIVLNARHNVTGDYMPREMLEALFGDNNLVKVMDIPKNPADFMVEAEKMTGIEGFVIRLKNGLWFKHKTEAYCILHHLKDSINNPKRLWEACVNETGDDLRALFKDDPISIEKIGAMEAKASVVYNHVHKSVNTFHNENKGLSRKDYAIKGQAELSKDGTFSLAMNLYIGREANVKEFLVKNYKSYGISDAEPEEATDE